MFPYFFRKLVSEPYLWTMSPRSCSPITKVLWERLFLISAFSAFSGSAIVASLRMVSATFFAAESMSVFSQRYTLLNASSISTVRVLMVSSFVMPFFRRNRLISLFALIGSTVGLSVTLVCSSAYSARLRISSSCFRKSFTCACAAFNSSLAFCAASATALSMSAMYWASSMRE